MEDDEQRTVTVEDDEQRTVTVEDDEQRSATVEDDEQRSATTPRRAKLQIGEQSAVVMAVANGEKKRVR